MTVQVACISGACKLSPLFLYMLYSRDIYARIITTDEAYKAITKPCEVAQRARNMGVSDNSSTVQHNLLSFSFLDGACTAIHG